MSRGLAGVGAIAALLFGLFAPSFRSGTGLLDASAALPFSAAVALVFLATLPRMIFGNTGGWLALAAIGHGAVLQLTNAGPGVGFQHLSVPWRWSGESIAPLVILAIQTVVVGRAARGLPLEAWHWGKKHLPGWRLWTLAGFFTITAATVSADPKVYAAELVLAFAIQCLMLLTIVLAARALPPAATDRIRVAVRRCLGEPSEPASKPLLPDRFVWLTALWVFGITSALAVFVYGRLPHVPDEVAYLFHANYFAAGRLWLELPPVEDAFKLGLVAFDGGRWYSPVPPAWPAALAVGARFGVAYLVNPILAAANVLLAYGLLGHLFGRRMARLGILLLAVSPWFLFLGMSFMTHIFSMANALAAAWCVARLRRGGSMAWAIPGGLAIGLIALTRPLEGMLVAVLLGFWALLAPGGRFVVRLTRVAALAMVTMATAAVTLPYNQFFTGDPLAFPLIEYTDRIYGAGTNAFGFGPDRGLGWSGLDPLPGHGVADILINGNLNLFSVNTELLGWGAGSLLIVLLGVLGGRLARADRWMIVAAATVIGAHCFYWFSGGPDFGARYWFLILLPCIALAARGVETLAAWMSDYPGGTARVHFAVAALAVISMTVFIPWRSIDKYRDYRGMRPDMRRLAAVTDFGEGLVLIRGREFPDYAAAAVLNPIDLRAPQPVYARDAGPDALRALAIAFPDRPVWIVEGPNLTGGGYRVVAGPLAPGSSAEVMP